MTKYLTKEHRQRLIIDAATEIAVDGQLYDFGIEAVGVGADCSHSLIIYHFGSLLKLRIAVIEQAIENDNVSILAQAIIKRDPVVDGITSRQRKGILLAYA
jgi:AcrR family transcriptional regulator